MLNYMKSGWKTTTYHPWIISVLFIYQLVWSVIFYQFIQSIVVPLLHRYPDEEMPATFSQIFIAESQFRLWKTDLAHFYLWVLFAFVMFRIIMTPILNAGIYYSLHQPGTRQIRPFFQGIKQMAIPFAFIYAVQLMVMLFPLYWIIPYGKQILMTHFHQWETALVFITPLMLGYMVYCSFVRLCFMFIQFGKVGELTLFHSLKSLARSFGPMIGISCLLFLFYGICVLISTLLSIVWAGFLAVVIHQLFYLVKSIFHVWEISSQYHLWNSNV